MTRNRKAGFSLVEVVIALGVISFALVSLMALLPIGIKTNQVSAEETRAAMILSAVEADLRNTYPQANFNGKGAGKSQIFGLALPYAVSSGTIILNSSLSVKSMSTTLADAVIGSYTTELNAYEQPVGDSWSAYRVTIIYTKVPSSDALAPIEARLVVNWPGLSATDAKAYTYADLTDPGKVSGFVEKTVTFPAP